MLEGLWLSADQARLIKASRLAAPAHHCVEGPRATDAGEAEEVDRARQRLLHAGLDASARGAAAAPLLAVLLNHRVHLQGQRSGAGH